MKTACVFIVVFLIAFVANSDAYVRRRKTSEVPSSSGVFLSYLKRQNKDLSRTIDTLEDIQQQQMFLTSAKEKFWQLGKTQNEVTLRCCGCPVGSCRCCGGGVLGFCCDWLEEDNKNIDASEETDEI